MTLQKQDIQLLEDLIRKVVREEIRNAMREDSRVTEFASDEEFRLAAAKIFSSHKKVLDALA